MVHIRVVAHKTFSWSGKHISTMIKVACKANL